MPRLLGVRESSLNQLLRESLPLGLWRHVRVVVVEDLLLPRHRLVVQVRLGDVGCKGREWVTVGVIERGLL